MENELRKRRLMFVVEAWDDKCARCQLCHECGSGDSVSRDRSTACLEAEDRMVRFNEIFKATRKRADDELETIARILELLQ